MNPIAISVKEMGDFVVLLNFGEVIEIDNERYYLTGVQDTSDGTLHLDFVTEQKYKRDKGILWSPNF